MPGNASSEAIDPDNEDHEAYLSKFKNKVTDKLRLLIEAHITNDPDVIKGRKKTVQVSQTKPTEGYAGRGVGVGAAPAINIADSYKVVFVGASANIKFNLFLLKQTAAKHLFLHTLISNCKGK